MCAQLSLAGFAEPATSLSPLSLHRPGRERLFLALQPPAQMWPALRQLEQQQRQLHGLQGTALRDEHLHITLQHLLDHEALPDDWIARAGVAVESVERHKLALRFDRVMSFARRTDNRPFVLLAQEGLQPLLGLQRALGEAMKRVGFLQVDRSFTPHVTLLYDRQQVPLQAIEPLQWQAQEMVLIHSLLGRTQHRVLARWPLC
ncbi:2'-5' RNA ligase [Permianibacter sp. IMCC34836]|uniref:2'-5' RNA ligase family protein n=1 Tax=Permianibacter fluminis TaxID=2738515 RepID=UPI001555919F|nr:2'-5' RNA ligase family protein [Permianibacter fluminis]NQD38644.1 2'-5' RNA ligase [Permianibacter fluminis]